MIVLTLGLAQAVFPTTATTGTNSETFALPARLCNLAYQYLFTTNPSAFTLNIQGSNDGTNFTTIDSTTVTTGGLRTITGLATNFIRINQAVTGGAVETLTLVAKAA